MKATLVLTSQQLASLHSSAEVEASKFVLSFLSLSSW